MPGSEHLANAFDLPGFGHSGQNRVDVLALKVVAAFQSMHIPLPGSSKISSTG